MAVHRVRRLFAFCMALMVGAAGSVDALDFNDVLLLKRAGLAESEIVVQVRLAGGVAMSPNQADLLRQAGASETLLGALDRVDRTAVAAAPAASRQASSVVTPVAVAAGPVRPVAIITHGAAPALCAKEGWVSVANSDVMSYYLLVSSENKRLFLSRSPNGGVEIPSGYEVPFALRKETYKLYGETGSSLSIKVREGEPTRLSLTPFGQIGNSGLTGTAQDRNRVRSEVLFGNYVPTAVIVRSPVIVAEPPPRVFFAPGHPMHYPPYYRRHFGGPYYGRGWW